MWIPLGQQYPKGYFSSLEQGRSATAQPANEHLRTQKPELEFNLP